MTRRPQRIKTLTISARRRNDLKMLTEGFLDRDWQDVHSRIENDEVHLRDMTATIVKILLPYRYYGDEVEEDEITDGDRVRLLLSVHTQLKQLWDSFKGVLFDHKDDDVDLGLEHYHNIKIPKTRPPKDLGKVYNTITIKANFDTGKINLIRDDIDLVNNFIGSLEGVPIDIFARCENCGKVIVVTRSDRKCCSAACAAGLIQKKKWAADPDACRERERERNRRRREQKRDQRES